MRGEAAGIARLWDVPETLPLIRRCGATFPRRGKALRKEERTIQTYLEQAFGKSDVTSAKMRAALREWLDLYYGAPRPGEDAAPRLAALIVGKLCRTVFAEYETRLPAAAPEAVQRSLEALNAAARTAMQYALVGGECLLKPVPADGGFDFTAIRRDCYVPLARDAHGRLLAVGTMERHSCDGRQYALLERRTAGAEGLTIETRLFELNGQMLGRCVPHGAADAAPSIDWGDGVLYDRARVWAEQREMVDAGLLRPELALAWYFDLPCETEAELAEIRRRFIGAERQKGGEA